MIFPEHVKRTEPRSVWVSRAVIAARLTLTGTALIATPDSRGYNEDPCRSRKIPTTAAGLFCSTVTFGGLMLRASRVAHAVAYFQLLPYSVAALALRVVSVASEVH